MNTRANIMYFLEQFLDLAHKDGNREYVRMIQRDIIRVVDAVAPDDGSGAANVRVVRKVLQSLNAKGYLETQAVTQIEEVLRERGTVADDMGMASPDDEGDVDMGDAPSAASAAADNTPAAAASGARTRKGAPPHKLDKRQIEQRIEEDRERHKRERESLWAVTSDGDDELNKLWEETSEFGEDDDRLIVEEADEFDKEMEMELEKCPHQHKDSNGHDTKD